MCRQVHSIHSSDAEDHWCWILPLLTVSSCPSHLPHAMVIRFLLSGLWQELPNDSDTKVAQSVTLSGRGEHFQRSSPGLSEAICCSAFVDLWGNISLHHQLVFFATGLMLHPKPSRYHSGTGVRTAPFHYDRTTGSTCEA